MTDFQTVLHVFFACVLASFVVHVKSAVSIHVERGNSKSVTSLNPGRERRIIFQSNVPLGVIPPDTHD